VNDLVGLLGVFVDVLNPVGGRAFRSIRRGTFSIVACMPMLDKSSPKWVLLFMEV
jgi:hypothetical protein